MFVELVHIPSRVSSFIAGLWAVRDGGNKVERAQRETLTWNDKHIGWQDETESGAHVKGSNPRNVNVKCEELSVSH